MDGNSITDLRNEVARSKTTKGNNKTDWWATDWGFEKLCHTGKR